MIQITDLHYSYPQSHWTLRISGLTLQSGQILGLVGSNGSGKTSLLKLAAGLLPLNPTTVWIEGRDVRDMSIRERARHVAYVPQDLPMQTSWSVEQFVQLGRSPYQNAWGRNSAADQAVVDEALERTGCQGLAEHSVMTLSGGQKRRVLLARALAQKTPYLLLDEPNSHLDLAHQQELRTLLGTLKSEGRAVLLSIHDLNFAAAVCDEIAVLSHGELLAVGPTATALTGTTIQQAFGVSARRIVLPDHPYPYLVI